MRNKNSLDKNTLLSLNMDPKSIDLHKLALTRMKNAKVDPSAKHDFIKDRIRTKNINNIDELYNKLNELEKNGVLDIWINKFGKDRYKGTTLKESTLDIPLDRKIQTLIENTLESIAEAEGVATASGTVATSIGAPIAYMNGPSKNHKRNTKGPILINKYPEGTHQDTNLGDK